MHGKKIMENNRITISIVIEIPNGNHCHSGKYNNYRPCKNNIVTERGIAICGIFIEELKRELISIDEPNKGMWTYTKCPECITATTKAKTGVSCGGGGQTNV